MVSEPIGFTLGWVDYLEIIFEPAVLCQICCELNKLPHLGIQPEPAIVKLV